MAEALFRRAVCARQEYRIVSAGVETVNGQSPNELSIEAMDEIGVDISHLRSTALTSRMVEEADYIFGMTRTHIDRVVKEFPRAEDKVFLLREFDDLLAQDEKYIADPIGGSLGVHIHCRNQIEQAVKFLVGYLERWDVITPDDDEQKIVESVALGSDHAGYELKEFLKRHLQNKRIRTKDFGPDSTYSADYPDFAKTVSQSVASGQFEIGILVCGTGIGMSIAANKQPGVRAGLVHDEQTARLARQHNNANVLCLGARQTTPELAIKMINAFFESHFEGGRHQRRISKLENGNSNDGKRK
jgi:RpiB/LacA/LacB family sugar-phosphate isomerase